MEFFFLTAQLKLRLESNEVVYIINAMVQSLDNFQLVIFKFEQ